MTQHTQGKRRIRIKNTTKIEKGAHVEQNAQGKNISQIKIEAPDPQKADLVRRRAGVVDELHKQMVALLRTFSSALGLIQNGQPTMEEQLESGFKAAYNFSVYLEHHRLYLSGVLHEKLDVFNRKLLDVFNAHLLFKMYSSPGWASNGLSGVMRSEKLNDIVKIVTQDLPSLLRDIETEMQKLLGVKTE